MYFEEGIEIMKKKSLPLSKVYQLLEPGPVVMVTTARKGKPNIMTMSWHMMVDFEPPLVAIVMGEGDYSFNISQRDERMRDQYSHGGIGKKVVGVGNTTGAKIDKFKKFNLTPTACFTS